MIVGIDPQHRSIPNRDRLNPVAVYTGVGSRVGVSLAGRHPMGFVNYKLTIAITKYYFATSLEFLQAILIIFLCRGLCGLAE